MRTRNRKGDAATVPAAASRPAPWAAIAACVFAGSAVTHPATGACPLDLAGTWTSGTASPSQRLVLTFADDGWATLLSGPPDRPVREYELLGAVEYAIVDGAVEFSAHRGVEIFRRGTSRWEISDYGDEHFMARESDAERERLWTRVTSQRYFLTFAAREPADGANDRPTAFVMWTEIDDRRIRRRALGTYSVARRAEPAEARFGRIPEPLADAFAAESDDEANTMLRVELNEAEWKRTFELYEAWDILERNDLLADEDPYLHAAELVGGVIQAVNRCRNVVAYDGERFGDAIRTPHAHALAAEGPLEALPGELIRHIERVNRRIHVEDGDLAEPSSAANE